MKVMRSFRAFGLVLPLLAAAMLMGGVSSTATAFTHLNAAPALAATPKTKDGTVHADGSMVAWAG